MRTKWLQMTTNDNKPIARLGLAFRVDWVFDFYLDNVDKHVRQSSKLSQNMWLSLGSAMLSQNRFYHARNLISIGRQCIS